MTGQRSLYLNLLLCSPQSLISITLPLFLLSCISSYISSNFQTEFSGSSQISFQQRSSSHPSNSACLHTHSCPHHLPTTSHFLPLHLWSLPPAASLLHTLCLRAKLLACRFLKGPIEICDVFHPGGHPKRWLWSIRLMRILNCPRSATVDFYLCYGAKWEPVKQRNRSAVSSHSLHPISFYICKEHRNQSTYPRSSTVNYYGARGQF